jgi:hypothetical protein
VCLSLAGAQVWHTQALGSNSSTAKIKVSVKKRKKRKSSQSKPRIIYFGYADELQRGIHLPSLLEVAFFGFVTDPAHLL